MPGAISPFRRKTAMTTSVQAAGKTFPGRARLPSLAGRSPGSQRPASIDACGGPRLPGFLHRERRTIRRRERRPALAYRDATQWLFRKIQRLRSGHHCPFPRPFLHRMGSPRHSTVAGSAVIAASKSGRVTFPFAPRSVAGFGNHPISRMIMLPPGASQSTGTGPSAQ